MKEFKKLVPAIKQATQQISEQINKSDFSGFSGKIQQAIKTVKQKMDNFKKSNNSNNLEVKVTTEDAKKQVTQLQKEIESLQKKINAKQTQLNITNEALDGIRNDTRQGVIKDMPDAGAKRIGQQTELRLVNNANYMELVKQSDKLNNEIIKYNSLLDSAKSKVKELGGETSKTVNSQNKSNNFASLLKSKIIQATSSVKGLKGTFNQVPKITQKVTNNIKGMGKGLKQGVGHILKYATALFSLHGIYSILSSSASSWLSSQNIQAQQLNTNIEYMKYAMR